MSVVPVTRGHHQVVSAGHELAAVRRTFYRGDIASLILAHQREIACIETILTHLAARETGGINHPRAPPLHAPLTQPPASPSPALS
ncbi:MAG: hypothetical protein OXI15_25400 [Chromatiales bacterium]|nr:hypothetical protein [Chromatiales bacterium]